VLAGDRALRGRQRHRPGIGQPPQRGRIAGEGGVTQFFGLAAQLVEMRACGQHVISSPPIPAREAMGVKRDAIEHHASVS
jgi:hypothetical protein